MFSPHVFFNSESPDLSPTKRTAAEMGAPWRTHLREASRCQMFDTEIHLLSKSNTLAHRAAAANSMLESPRHELYEPLARVAELLQRP